MIKYLLHLVKVTKKNLVWHNKKKIKVRSHTTCLLNKQNHNLSLTLTKVFVLPKLNHTCDSGVELGSVCITLTGHYIAINKSSASVIQK